MKRFDNITVISGGQTGIDQLGLFLAKTFGLDTGGTLPLGCKTEYGAEPALIELYNMQQSTQSNYSHRTRLNVENSNLTLIFGDIKSKGTAQTIDFCEVVGDNYLINPSIEEIKNAIFEISTFSDSLVINIAGNRATKLHVNTISDATRILSHIFKWLKNEEYVVKESISKNTLF